MLCATVFVQELYFTVLDFNEWPFATATDYAREIVVNRLNC